MPSFTTPGPAALTIRFAAGNLHVTADARDTTTVDVAPGKHSDSADVEHAAATVVEQRGDEIVVLAPDTKKWFGRNPKLAVRVAAPSESAVTTVVESADIRLEGALGDVDVSSASGQVRFDRAASFTASSASGDVWGELVVADARVKTASGDVRLAEVGGSGDLTSASGDLDVARVGRDARLRTASGDASIGSVGGSVSARTASGDIRIGSVRAGTVEIDSASGDVSIGVATGTAAWLEVQSLTGDVASELDATEPPGDDAPTVTIRARTLSGDIAVRRAGVR